MQTSPPSNAIKLTVGDMIRWLSNFNKDKQVTCYCPKSASPITCSASGLYRTRHCPICTSSFRERSVEMYEPNVVGALYKKIQRLNQRKSELTREYNEQCAAIDKELELMRSALQAVNDAVKDIICPCCGGTGEERYADAAGSWDTRECSSCHGTGIKN